MMSVYEKDRTIGDIEEWYAQRIEHLHNLDRIRKAAKPGYWGTFGYSRPTNTHTDLYRYFVTDAEGNVIKMAVYDKVTGKGTTISDLIDWIFDQGKEREWFISYIRNVTEERTVFDPDLITAEIERETAECQKRKDHLISEIRRKRAHYDRWNEACKWAKDNGVKYISSRYNRFSTVRRNVIEAGKIEEWNALFPEFRIISED